MVYSTSSSRGTPGCCSQPGRRHTWSLPRARRLGSPARHHGPGRAYTTTEERRPSAGTNVKHVLRYLRRGEQHVGQKEIPVTLMIIRLLSLLFRCRTKNSPTFSTRKEFFSGQIFKLYDPEVKHIFNQTPRCYKTLFTLMRKFFMTFSRLS